MGNHFDDIRLVNKRSPKFMEKVVDMLDALKQRGLDDSDFLLANVSLRSGGSYNRKLLKLMRTSRSHSESSIHLPERELAGGDLPQRKSRHAASSGRLSRRYLAKELQRLSRENESLSRKVDGKVMEHNQATVLELEKRLFETESLLERERKLAGQLRVQADKEVEFAQQLKTKNKEMSEDIFLLKNLVIRLNVELEHLQDRLRTRECEKESASQSNVHLSDDSGLADTAPPMRHKRNPMWGRAELSAVAPLLEAYEENANEKEQLILDYRQEMDQLTGRCKQIVAENEVLHTQLVETNQKGEVTYSEWVTLKRDYMTTREQNELLMRQTKLFQKKCHDLHSVYQTKLTEVQLDVQQWSERTQALKTELYVLKGRYSMLSEQHDRLKTENNNKIPLSVHNASVNECKRLFEELKQRYEEERDTLTRKVAALESSRPDGDVQLASLAVERDQSLAQVNRLRTKLQLVRERGGDWERKVSECERGREAARLQARQAVQFARELILEQENLLKQLAERTAEAKLNNTITQRMETLKTKLKVKGVEREARIEMEDMEQRIKEKATGVDRMKGHYVRQLTRLRQELKEKEKLIEKLQYDNKKAHDEVEVVWKAALAENKMIEESNRVTQLLHDDS